MQAQRHFLHCAQLAEAQGDAQRATVARQRVTELQEKVPLLVLLVPAEIAAIEGFEVRRDGEEWPEWQERGTGSSAPVNVFTPQNKPTDAVRGDDGKFRLPNRNYIEETANFYMLILNQWPTPEAVVMSLSKTGLKVARNWAYSLKNEFIQNPKTKKLFLAPSYYRIYRLSTEFTDNTKGAWWALKFEKGDFLNDEKVFDTAAAFSEQVRAGKVSVDYSDEESAASEDTPF